MRTLKKTLCLVLVACMMLGLCAFSTSAAFTDADAIQYEEAVAVLSGIGVINGNPNGDGTFNFAPAKTLSRAEACVIITKMLGDEDIAVDTKPFTDCVGHWGAKYISYCYNEGIVSGYGDDKFGPDDELTGSAWALMVLRAMGYDPAIEGIGGDTWEIGVAKLVKSTQIAADLDTAFDGSVACTRDAACQIAYTALQTNTVTYGTMITAEGKVVKFGPASPDTTSLADVIFPTLVFTSSTPNAYGEAANTVTYKGKPIYTEAINEVLTYTTAKTEAQVKKDFGKNANFTAVTSAAALAGQTGTGKEVRVEYSVNPTTGVKTVIQATVVDVEYGALQVAATAATPSKGAYKTYSVGGTLSGDVFSTVVDETADVDTATVYAGAKAGDMVAIKEEADGTVTVTALKSVSGKVMSKTSAGVYTIGADTYVESAYKSGLTITVNPKATADSEFYVDLYGNLLTNKSAAAAATVYALVADAKTTVVLDAELGLVNVYTADLIKADGSVETIKVASSAAGSKGTVVEVGATNKNTGITTISSATTVNVTGDFSTKILATGMYANESTVFVAADWTTTGTPKFAGTATVKTGIANMAKVAAVTAYAIDTSAVADGVADLVFIYTTSAAAVAGDNYVYVTGTNVFDGTNYTCDVIVKGEATTVVADSALSAGLYSATSVTNGVVTGATPATGSAYTTKISTVGGMIANNGVIDATYADKTVAADAPVYVINTTTKSCSVMTVADLATAITCDGAYFVASATAVSAIYVLVH